jgi:hydrogenase expression/formation protein HypD
MEIVSAFRDPGRARALARAIARAAPHDRRIRIMEICGTHTVAVHRHGLKALLPENVELVSGPGCPVCVTDQVTIDHAIDLALYPKAHLVTFGDMFRVPGSAMSLDEARAHGARATAVASPREALRIAGANPHETVIFFAIGFETTAPAVAALVAAARRERVRNLAILSALKRVPPVMAQLAAAPDLAIDAFLCPAHVSAVIGARAYEFLARDHRRPCVIAGFEPLDILYGVLIALEQLATGRAEVVNEYARVVRPAGNPAAQALIAEIFVPAAAHWRGIGCVQQSGLYLTRAHADFDVERRLPVPRRPAHGARGCICGAILRGAATPEACPLFGHACTPATPVGPCMVSAEGTCAAHYRYESPEPALAACGGAR